MPVSFGVDEERGSSNMSVDDETEEFRRKNRFKQVKLSLLHLLPCQLLLLLLLLRFGRYESAADVQHAGGANTVTHALGGGAGKGLEAMHMLRNFTFQVIEAVLFVAVVH